MAFFGISLIWYERDFCSFSSQISSVQNIWNHTTKQKVIFPLWKSVMCEKKKKKILYVKNIIRSDYFIADNELELNKRFFALLHIALGWWKKKKLYKLYFQVKVFKVFIFFCSTIFFFFSHHWNANGIIFNVNVKQSGRLFVFFMQ